MIECNNGRCTLKGAVNLENALALREDGLRLFTAAEITLDRALPGLLSGTAPRIAMDLRTGSYFGARRPEDGRIDWRLDAQRIHNLVRAVAPPLRT